MSTITDLTGYTWTANNSVNVNIGQEAIAYFINFTANEKDYTRFTIWQPVIMVPGDAGSIYYAYYTEQSGYVDTPAYDGNDGWRSGFQKINITGGADTTNTAFIQWLQQNGTLAKKETYYTITFNRNGATSGDVPSIQEVVSGTTFELNNYNPGNLAKTDSTFLGWNTTADATEVINEIIVTSDVTLYAIFKETKSDVFELKLYQSTAEPNRVNKTSYLTLVNTIQGALRNYTSITDLSITIEYEPVPNFNYIYIPIFNRYYFVTDISSVREHLWEISASCDVLMTYKDSLLNCSAFIDRNENSYDQLIIDNKLPIKQGQTVDVHFITNTLFDINDGYYVLQGLNLSVEEDTETPSNVAEVKEVEVNGN